MSEPAPDQNLHLPSLVIKNFRGIDELTIPRLGRVTLLTGKNGVGKTTVLDAVRIYAARAGARMLSDVLLSKDEFVNAMDINGQAIDTPDWQALFNGGWNSHCGSITIGTISDPGELEIRADALEPNEVNQLIDQRTDLWTSEPIYGLRVTFLGAKYTMPASYVEYSGSPTTRHRVRPAAARMNEGQRPPNDILSFKLGPHVPDTSEMELYLNDVLLTPDEQYALDALNLVAEQTVDRVAVLGSGTRRDNAANQRVMARFVDGDAPVPLRSLGDGAVRIFVSALALASSRGGILLIDEAENGIHHSVQAKFWNMVLQTAQRNNVQVIATTHSWDCVEGFAQAANELEDIEGLLVRIERVPVGLRAITYDESRLASVTKYDIEVR